MQLNYRISMWNYTHYSRRMGLEEMVREIADAGYGIELWPAWREDGDLHNPVYRDRLKLLLSDIESSWHTGAVNDFEGNKTQVDTAAAVGSDVVVVHPGTIQVDGDTPDYGLARGVVDYAKEQNVTIALENGPLDVLTRALEQVDGLAICIDTGHIYFTEQPMEAYLDALKHRLVHLHVQEAEASSDHYVPGTGVIPKDDWNLFLQTLEEIQFSGAAVFEIRPRTPLQTAEAAIAFLEHSDL